MSTPQLERWQRYIVLAHISLAVLFGVIVPPWEAHDETGHYAYVNDIVTTHSLPDAFSGQKVFLDQSHQPPLYYLVVAGLTFWVDRSDSLTPQTNLFAFDGTNRRGTRILLRNAGETFPWSGTILAIHAARVVSALLSGLMILVVAKTARHLLANAPAAALLITAIAAFNPQVLFMSGMVNNDVMVSLAGAVFAYMLVRISSQPPGSEPSSSSGQTVTPGVRQRFPAMIYGLLGATLGLCLLSKNSALILIPFTAIALIYVAWRQRWPARQFILRGLLAAVATLVVAGPLYLSNYARYHQWIVDRASESAIVQAPVSVIGEGLAVSLRDQWLPQVFVNAFRTFWGTFGWGNVQMPDAIYLALAVFCTLGIVGFVIGVRAAERAQRDSLGLLLALGLAMMLLPGYRAIFYQDPALLPGRYLMPALTAYCTIIGFGWYSLLKRILFTVESYENGTLRIGRRVEHFERYDIKNNLVGLVPFMAVGFALFALAVPFLYIAPVYAPPQIRMPGGDPPTLLTFADVAQVTDISASTTYLSDREGLRHYAHVQITWRALRRTATNYAVGVSILGRDNEVLGNLNVQPARGNYPSSNWNPGDTFDDDYYVLLERPCAALPALGHVSISLYQFQQAISNDNSTGISITRELQARDGAGRTVSPILGRFRIDAPSQPMPVFWQPPLGMLDNIALRRVSLPATVSAGSTVTVALTYETWKGDNPQGTGFVHLFDSGGVRVAQDDHAPVQGAYPTDFWKSGECVSDTFSLSIPITATGTLHAVTGFYSPAGGQRFSTGTRDNLLPIGDVRVLP